MQPLPVAKYCDLLFSRYFRNERDARACKFLKGRLNGIPEYLGQIKVLLAVGQCAEVREGKLIKIFNQAMQPKRFCMERANGLGGGIADPFHEGLYFTSQHR